MICPQCYERSIPEIGGTPLLCPPCLRRCWAVVYGAHNIPAPGTPIRALWDLTDQKFAGTGAGGTSAKGG